MSWSGTRIRCLRVGPFVGPVAASTAARPRTGFARSATRMPSSASRLLAGEAPRVRYVFRFLSRGWPCCPCTTVQEDSADLHLDKLAGVKFMHGCCRFSFLKPLMFFTLQLQVFPIGWGRCCVNALFCDFIARCASVAQR